MALPTVFANENGNQPASQLDDNFNAVGNMGGFTCNASGTNNITLTPVVHQPTISAYFDLLEVKFVAPNTSTSSVQVRISLLSLVPLYNTAGAQCGPGEVSGGIIYNAIYSSSLNSGSGGFQLTGGGQSALSNVTSINGGQIAGLRNRLINGAMAIDQRSSGGSKTITSGVGQYAIDRWLITATGANITCQRTTSSLTSSGYVMSLTGAASVTKITADQRIESLNISDYANETVTLSSYMSNTLLTTVTWRVYYAASVDDFSSLVQIDTGTFTVTSSLVKHNAQISLPANAGNGVMVRFEVGAQVSGTFKLGDAQLEIGNTASDFEDRMIGPELLLAQRYYNSTQATSGIFPVGNAYAASATDMRGFIPTSVAMRTAPTIAGINSYRGGAGNRPFGAASNIVAQINGINFQDTGVTGATTNQTYAITADTATLLTLSAEL